MQISPLGSWLVSALPISIGGEWHNSSSDFNHNTNSSILLKYKNMLQVHIKPTPTNYVLLIISIVFEIKKIQ
jgi:hypothetical protein